MPGDKDAVARELLALRCRRGDRAALAIQRGSPEVELPEPADVLDSPRLIALAKEINAGSREVLKKFWDEMQDKAPLVEPDGKRGHTSLVTFVWRGNGKTRRVGLIGGLPTLDGEKWLTRLPNTDLVSTAAAAAHCGVRLVTEQRPPCPSSPKITSPTTHRRRSVWDEL